MRSRRNRRTDKEPELKIGQNAPADDVRVGQPYGQLQVGPETVDPDRHLGTTAKEKHFLFLKEKTGKELLLLLRRRAVQGQGKGAAVLAVEALDTRSKGSALAAKAVGTRSKGSALPAKAVKT